MKIKILLRLFCFSAMAILGVATVSHHDFASFAAPAKSDCEIFLSPDAAGKPVIEAAVNAAQAGCTIRLRKGTYKEIITITKTIALVGEPGAAIDPSEIVHPEWKPATAYGSGVYQAVSERAPVSLLIDGKFLAQVNPGRPETQPGKAWDWKRLIANGPPRAGFRYVRGVWLYLPEEKLILVHLENNASPAPLPWSAIWTLEPAITVKNTQDVAIRGLTIAHAYNGISIVGNCLRCSITHSVVGPWDMYGVQVRDGATETLVEDNEIFRGPYEDWTPRTTETPTGMAIDPAWYEVWQVHKLAGFWDRVGVSVTLSGANNKIHANRIHDVFDGINLGEGEIESLDTPTVDPKHDQGTEISENTIERTADSGMEVGGPAVNARIHNNILRFSHGGLRYKLPRIGPIFIYRNVLVDGSPNDIWYSMDDSTAEGYVYHNTIVGGRVGLSYHRMPKRRKIGAPKWHYMNNLVLAQRGFFETHDAVMPINFFADYNVVQGEGRPYPGDPSRDTHSKYVSKIEMDAGFPPKPVVGSPAIDAGLDLSTYLDGKPLPGCEPGYFKGKAPDAGAYEVQ